MSLRRRRASCVRSFWSQRKRSIGSSRRWASSLLTNLAIAAAQHIDELAHLLALLALVAAGDGVLDAMRDVILEDFLLRPPQRRAHRRNLRDDIDAVAIILDHAGEPAHLALDAAEPPQARGLGFLADDR